MNLNFIEWRNENFIAININRDIVKDSHIRILSDDGAVNIKDIMDYLFLFFIIFASIKLIEAAYNIFVKIICF
jgi:hypothetical protein